MGNYIVISHNVEVLTAKINSMVIVKILSMFSAFQGAGRIFHDDRTYLRQPVKICPGMRTPAWQNALNALITQQV